MQSVGVNHRYYRRAQYRDVDATGPNRYAGLHGLPCELVDGGFRRGTDVFKALALGTRAVGIGRPHIWGLTTYGQAGVERVLEMLRAEWL